MVKVAMNLQRWVWWCITQLPFSLACHFFCSDIFHVTSIYLCCIDHFPAKRCYENRISHCLTVFFAKWFCRRCPCSLGWQRSGWLFLLLLPFSPRSIHCLLGLLYFDNMRIYQILFLWNVHVVHAFIMCILVCVDVHVPACFWVLFLFALRTVPLFIPRLVNWVVGLDFG